MSKIKRNPAYKAIHTNRDKRYVIITGGRGSGKSFEIATGLVLQTYEERQRILFTRLTMTSAHLSIIPEFVEKLDLLDVNHVFNVNRTEITNKLTGSDIIFKGIKASSGDQSANLKSISGVNTWVMDEAEELLDEETFDKIDFSIRVKGQKNTIYLILNPTTKEHWIWKRFFEGNCKYIEIDGCQIPISTHPQVLHIHTTYLDNLGNLNESFLDNVYKMKKDNFPKYEQIVIGGWRQKPQGVIFEKWKIGEFPKTLPYVWGMDFGYAIDPTTLVKCSTREEKGEKKLFMKEYCYKPNMSTDDILALLDRYVKKYELIVADSAEPRLINEIRQKGYNIIGARKGKDSIMAGISKIQDYELIVDGDSKNLMIEFDNYAWDETKGKPIDNYNHCFIGNTMIYTSSGIKKIEDIKVGDVVQTSGGWNEVLRKYDNGEKEITEYSLVFDTFSISLHSTDNHKIKTSEGWKEIQELCSGDVLYLHKSFWGRNIDYTKEKNIIVGEQKGFIESFGNILKVKFLKTIMFITSIMIHMITQLKIYRSCVSPYICDILEKRDSRIIQSGQKNFMLKELKQLKTGISLMKEGDGIVSMVRKLGLTNLLIRLTVLFAEVNIKLHSLIDQSIAIKTAKLKHLEKGEKRKEIVYDFMVENNHEYFANGVLVHNCMDGIRYAMEQLSQSASFYFK